MTHLSESRIEAMALACCRALESAAKVDVGDTGAATRKIAARLRSEFGEDSDLDRQVRARIASLSRDVPEGGREWQILYRQYSDELSRRR